MLVKIGARTQEQTVVDLLTECHGRIRRFLSLAQRLAEAAPGEVADLAGQVRRYFSEAFPLHVADEEELLAPALAGASAEVDQALAEMHREHGAHEAAVARLVAAREVPELVVAACALAALVEPHLAREESVIFPALAALPAAQSDAIRRRMRDRRDAIS
jgi:iron-sulfur cluster repair protein YtfE (RIC family)